MDLLPAQTYVPSPSSIDRLPVDTITNILTRIPNVKSLLQYRTVSKAWCSVIDNHNFRRSHLKHHQNSPNPSSFIFINNGSLNIVEDEILPSNVTPLPSSERLFLVGSSNGLVCLSTCFTKVLNNNLSIYICNPATRQDITLPEIPRSAGSVSASDSADYVSSGFGFDPITNEYKVLYKFFRKDDEEAEIYTYTLGSSNSWKKITGSEIAIPCGGGTGVFINRSVYWHFNLPNTVRDGIVLSFDMWSEKSEIIHRPSLDQEEFGHIAFPYRVDIGLLGDSVCLSNCGLYDDQHEIWVMKEEDKSWTKVFIIRKDFLDHLIARESRYGMVQSSVREVSPVLVRKNGDIILLCDDSFLVVYNFESGKGTMLEDDNFPKYEKLEKPSMDPIVQVFPYVPSLVSPEAACGIRDNGIEEEEGGCPVNGGIEKLNLLEGV